MPSEVAELTPQQWAGLTDATDGKIQCSSFDELEYQKAKFRDRNSRESLLQRAATRLAEEMEYRRMRGMKING